MSSTAETRTRGPRDRAALTEAPRRAVLLALLALLPSGATAVTYKASNGRMVYGDGGAASAVPSSSAYAASSTFGVPVQLPAGAANQTFFVLKSSPMSNEYLAGYVTTAGVLNVLRYNGTASVWTFDWSATVGGDGVNGRRFDIAYEKATGRGIVAYSANAANAAMHYRVWDPVAGTWGTEQTFSTARLSGTANWVKLASDPKTNRVGLAVADTSSYLTALTWNGSTWGGEPSYALSSNPLYYSSTIGDSDSFDLAFGSNSGDLTVAWGANPSSSVLCVNRLQAASASWLASTYSFPVSGFFGIPTAGTQVLVAADSQSDAVGVVYTGMSLGSPYLSGYIWNGSSWSSNLSFNTFGNFAGGSPHQRAFTAFWLRPNGYPSLVVPQADSGATTGKLSYAIANLDSTRTTWLTSVGLSASITWPWATGTAQKIWFQGVSDPGNPSAGMVLFADTKGSLWAKQVTSQGGIPPSPASLTWSNADGGAALTSSLASTTSQSFAFDFDHPPLTVFGDNSGGEAAANAPACADAGSGQAYDVDHFTLFTTSGSDVVTALSLKMSAASYAAVGSVYLTSDDGKTMYSAYLSQPSPGTYALSLYPGGYINVTTTPTQYRLMVIPATTAALPSGTNYTIAANVGGITANNNFTLGWDPSSGSVVIDRIPPADPTWGTISALPGQGLLAWTNPGTDYANTVILRSASGSTITNGSLTDGSTYAQGATLTGTPTNDTVAYNGPSTSFIDNSGNAGGTYYYRAFAADACNNYSPGQTTTAAFTVPPVSNLTTVGTLIATATSCTGVTLTANFTGDGNGNNAVSFTRNGAAVTCAPKTRNPPVNSTAGGNNGTWTCVDAPPSANATYTYGVTFTDADNGASWTGSATAAPVTETACPGSNGRVAFSTGSASTTPSGDPYTASSNTFGASFQLPAGAANQTFFVLKASPTSNEYLAGYVTTGGVLNVLRYDGATSTWSTEWSATVGGDGVNGRRFDIAYEKLSGHGMVAYSANRAASNSAMRYRIWNPATGYWGTEQTFGTLQLGGTANWVKLVSRPNTNEIAAGVVDTNSYITAVMWNGSSWGSEPTYSIAPTSLTNGSTPGDIDAFDLAYGSLTGDLFVAWSANVWLYTIQYQRASASWQASSSSNMGGLTLDQVVLAADPLSDKVGVIFYSQQPTYVSNGYLYARVWTGLQWNKFVGVTNSSSNPIANYLLSPSPHSRQYTAFWLNIPGTSALIVPYSEKSGTINKISYSYSLNNGASNFSAGLSASVTWNSGSTKTWFQGVTDLGSPDRAMVVFSDSKGYLWAKRVVLSAGPTFTWTDTEGTKPVGSNPPLTNSLASTTSQSFAFDYDHPPVTVFADNTGLEAVTGSLACAATTTSNAIYDLDHFTLVTSANSWPNGTDTVTQVTVNVTAGNSAVGTLYVTSDTGVVYGSLGYQASGTYAIPVSIPVNTTVTQYRIQVKPALFSALPAGANYPIAANVASIAATNAIGGSDPSNGSVVIDRVPPSAPVWGTSSTAPGQVLLNWTNPGTNYANTVILRSGSGSAVATSSLLDGNGYAQGQSLGGDAVAYSGSGSSATDNSGAGTFYYRAFAADACNNYSAGATTATAASPPPIANPTTVVGLGASATSCTAVTLSASFTGDGDGNNSVAFTRDGNPVTCVSLKRSGSGNSGSWTCADSVPSADATYSYAVTFADADGVSGANPITASVTQAACPANGGTLSLGAHPSGASPGSTANPGQTNVLAGRFSLTANATGSGGSVSLNQILLANTGTATSADLGNLNFYADVGSVAGSWDPTDQLVATATWSSAASAWVASGFNVPLGTTSYILTLAPAYGATPGRTFALSFATSSITADPGISVVGSQAITGGTVTIASTPAGQKPGDTATGSMKPMVLILNPVNGATMSIDNSPTSKGVRVQVQVYDPSHTAIGSVTLSHDGGQTFPDSLTLNPTYDPVVNPNGKPYYAHVYQADLTTIAAGSWTLQAMAVTTGGGAGYSAPITVTVGAKGSGDGNLLVRNDSNQLCIDCHALQTHSSQSVSAASGISKYGSWATSCRDCHTPHRTRNAQLVSESIVPPAYSSYQNAKAVRFWDRKTGDSGTADAISFVSSSAPLANGLLGPCQACHTRTGGAVARWRNTGNSDSHFAAASTQACTSCHTHSNGFGGQESLGGQSCGTCHNSTFWNMQAAGTPAPAMPRLTKHTLGAGVQGTNDSPLNPSLAWGNPLAANDPAIRSCVGMCHGDHVHNDPAAWPVASHANNFYANATTQASRSLTRDQNVLDTATYGFATSASTGSVSARDFVSGQYTQGCLACHTNPVDSSHPGLSGAAYDASAHNVTVTPAGLPWGYVTHDGSRFARNCTKCHAGNQAEGQAVSYRGSVQGVHYSDNPSLLAGAVRPAGNAASNVCYNCHGNGVVGANNSNKNIASEFAKAGSAHPANADSIHDTLAEAALTWGNALGFNNATSRHANCLDCHNPHLAQQTVNDTGGNKAGPSLAGATGARLSSNPAVWTVPTAANFTTISITPGTDLEATLCFKCHSSFYWGTDAAKIPASPSNGLPETDQAMEFNPANASFHPVLAQAPNPTPNILKPWTTTSLMRCTNCHASDTTTDPDGPHGSAAKFLLKGPNTDWSSNITMSNRSSYRVFCGNCHDVVNWTNTLSAAHYPGGGAHANVECFTCHAAVPHGGPRPGLIVARAGVAAGVPAQTSYDTSGPYFQGGYIPQYFDNGVYTGLYIVSYPTAGAAWQNSNCSCNGPNHH